MDELQLMAADFIQIMHGKGHKLPETEEFFNSVVYALGELCT
jgi:hypothetical protein